MSSVSVTKKPHAVCIPYPAQGHINPILKLAKLLHHKGFHITFINTEHIHKRVLKAQGADSLKGLTDFRFETIPDGLPPSDTDTPRDFPALCESIGKNCLVPFRDLVTDLNSPPVSCIVSDGAMSFTLEVAQEMKIPNVLFWTISACGLMGYLQFPHLIKSGLIPIKGMDLNSYLDTPIDFISGVKDICLRDIPTFIRTTDPKDIVLNYLLGEIHNASRADAVVLNTFDELEHGVLSAIESLLPPIYTIGALHLLVNQIPENRLNAIESSLCLWKEESRCLQWLDSKKPNSVVYVNFGSIAIMTHEQIFELAWGLSDSEQTFLWVIRPEVVSGESAILSLEFIDETKERGLVSSWCPQEQVLSHPSTCCFVTHNGWNSTIESVCSGVPMICWPFAAEQQMNCHYSCRHWGIGMEVDENVKRDGWNSLVRELMEGKKGKKMKMKAMEWKIKAEEATGLSGSSYVKLDKLVNEIFMR